MISFKYTEFSLHNFNHPFHPHVVLLQGLHLGLGNIKGLMANLYKDPFGSLSTQLVLFKV